MGRSRWFLSNYFSLFGLLGLIFVLNITGCATSPEIDSRAISEPLPTPEVSTQTSMQSYSSTATSSPADNPAVAPPKPLQYPATKPAPTQKNTPKTTGKKPVSAASTSSVVLTPQQTPEGLLITLDERYFSGDRMRVATNQAAFMQKIAELFRQYPHRQGKIEAIVNDVGSADYLRGVSQRLADAVLYELVERGVESRRLLATGLGARPLSAVAPRGQMGQRQVTILLLP
ncbi:OmpA family protein [Thioflexithrix psekupsensis]|uniref:OmpA-like domain-containing protein n=1 Tax=Thioflexithrix psekupsensis TaxID=1570016 RepID=A0A251XC84_9GAMM|nr:OmpA family protein [Thioflexithrix psekupsensis]OUD15700.1 hypothetical protein TPSD3_04085 [Thioflexithrix psekupsensis]